MFNSKQTLRGLLELLNGSAKLMVPYCEEMASNTTCSFPTRLLQVDGHDGRKNDLIYCKPSTTLLSNSTVVYFGGDVQDFKENMEVSTEKKSFLKWNLDNMSLILRYKFPESHVIIVRPSRMDFDLYSCFVNFVPSIKYGIPKHIPMNYAFEHLLKLLNGVALRLNSTYSKEDTPSVDLSATKLILIGFSKGCVVLNQFLYEFHSINASTLKNHGIQKCIPQITDMFWLDAGHGAKNVFLTSRSLLQTLAESDIRIHIHVTPYQVRDKQRPWIGQEESQFTMLLEELNANFERTLHFENEPSSLSLHFEILSVFKMSGDVQLAPD